VESAVSKEISEMSSLANSELDHIFLSLSSILEQELHTKEEIRKLIKDIEFISRKMATVLQQIHNPQKISEIKDICKRAREFISPIADQFTGLQLKIKHDEVYKFHDHWKSSLQQIISMISLITWLEQDRLITPQEVEHLLHLSKLISPTNFGIELDDYLIGLCNIPNELSRLCVNSVTAGDFIMPHRIVKFVSELYAGFRLLNLKNDFLRKRYDSIKYDLKKIEEVVYDISIRKLGEKPAESSIV